MLWCAVQQLPHTTAAACLLVRHTTAGHGRLVPQEGRAQTDCAVHQAKGPVTSPITAAACLFVREEHPRCGGALLEGSTELAQVLHGEGHLDWQDTGGCYMMYIHIWFSSWWVLEASSAQPGLIAHLLKGQLLKVGRARQGAQLKLADRLQLPSRAQANLLGPDNRARPLQPRTVGPQLEGAHRVQSTGREPPPVPHQVRSSAGCYPTVRLCCHLHPDLLL